ncbi:GNAT family N-acetyltransferase [Paraflavitalea speifideaquila]|uniref:GNAT family N-acetyltransferase n=1 Tax=Paraflavitalea speifideaquila TaxID=3076558 RepID=UPI0028F02428|nr:GNAT family N-acetyltransferase [Paraflavitalea speifideiaquila]
MIIAETERLLVRQITVEDAPFILQLVNEPAWLTFIGDKGVRNLEDAVKYIHNVPLKSYQENGFGLWLVLLKEEQIPIGMCGLIKRDALQHVDIGFAYLAPYEGKGYGYEAATAVLVHAKNKYALPYILAITNQDNVRSIRLLDKLGLKYERMITMPGDKKPIVLMGASLQPQG